MNTKSFTSGGGPLANPPTSDFLDLEVAFNVPKGFVIPQGSCWSLDQTQPTTSPASLISGYYGAAYSPTIQAVVPPYSANATKAVGVYQGPALTTTTAALGTFGLVRVYGVGLVLAAAEGGTAINVGSNLVISATQFGAKQGTAALNSQIGMAIAYQINGLIPLATLAGAQTVVVNTPPGITGITTTTALTIDTLASGLQETVTPTAVAAGVNGSQTYTVAGVVSAGQTITATITPSGGSAVALVYTQVAADTATTAAAAMVQLINASSLVSGATPVLLPATNAAGVITVRANTSGTGPNAITTVAANGTGFTLTAGGATLAGGTSTTFTATFGNAHAANTPYYGTMRTNAGTLILGTASALTPQLLNAFIQVV